MREYFKTYYLKNGRLDLSLLEDHQEEVVKETRQAKIPKIYVDDKISSILEEMGNCFLEEEKI
ncbi:MAG: hypothetical protein H9893_13745 [Candidatus Niameybacter stercoravium]|nr:hypothetical protein [Candidatus Niameybacter stercoravium]